MLILTSNNDEDNTEYQEDYAEEHSPNGILLFNNLSCYNFKMKISI